MSIAAWRHRFLAPTITLPGWARDNPDRLLYTTNASGKYELYAWDRIADSHRQVTDRPTGTTMGRLDRSGEWVWWFDDSAGNELGRWMREPFVGGKAALATGDLPPAYSAGLALGRGFAVVGSSLPGQGVRIELLRDGEAQRLLYADRRAANISGLSDDDSLLCISHSEFGDAMHRSLRVIDLEGRTIGELSDGPQRDLQSAGFSRISGDQRLIVVHQRRDLPRPLIWDPTTGETTDVEVDLPGEVVAVWYPDGKSLLVGHSHRGRSEIHRYDIDARTLTRVETEPGSIMGAAVRPDGELWYSWSSSATPMEIRANDRVLLRPPGEPAPGGVAYTDLEVDGVHAFVAEPAGPRPHPTIFQVHGGPSAHDTDRYSPRVQALVDHGFAVVLVNYRGSTGYGREWRDALIGRPGLTELEDVAAVYDWLVAQRISDPAKMVLAGGSWGGYLTLLGLGVQPERWALGLSTVPIADWLSQYDDVMEPLKALDRALFGGSPDEIPEVYRRSSPATYVESVRAPVLISAGENDPRCPIRQIESYVSRLEDLEKPHQVYRYQAGHGSLLTDETLRQVEMSLDFAARHLGTAPPK